MNIFLYNNLYYLGNSLVVYSLQGKVNKGTTLRPHKVIYIIKNVCFLTPLSKIRGHHKEALSNDAHLFQTPPPHKGSKDRIFKTY